MKEKPNDRSGNYLFALNIFIAFLLLFQNRLVIPYWLQPVGRMHTMLLHFPIVLLLLSMAMEFFRLNADDHTNEIYLRFRSALMLAGVIFSGITVIMGIFLSREAGYSESMLSWHRLWGASVFFTASFIYAFRHSKWYRGMWQKAGAIAVTLCLVAAGHFGAAITHGDNFIWKPVLVSGKRTVPLEEAEIFEHVVKPVFEQKCVSCHNAEKLKGQLKLTDSASIVKGGKSGKLFVAGKPDSSLLMRRIHLPLDERKHMPPSGKPQLTDDEEELLVAWIKSGPRFSGKVTGLSPSDTLRLQAMNVLTAGGNREENFSFPAAEQETLQSLNSNYRVVSPVSENSPALTVNIYNKDSYTPQTLDDLDEVRRQIIWLDLGKMPVRDQDLKYLLRFENLRKLNLNFTNVTGEGIQALARLKELQSLSLSGTSVNYSDVRRLIPQCKKLQTLAIWNTAMSADEIERLQSEFRSMTVLGGMAADGRPLIKLNPPKLRNISPVFTDSISPELFHPVKGVNIRFTTDGSDPDSTHSKLAGERHFLKASTEIKARAFKAGWLSSDVAVLNVYRSGIRPDTAILLSRLNRVHTANGAQTFFDHQLGSFNANSPAWANNWAGFIKNPMELLVRFDKPKRVSSVSLNTLIETENFIFPPEVIEVWGGSTEDHLRLIHRIRPQLPTNYRKPFIKLFDASFDSQQVSCLKIIAKPVMKIPAWHKNKNKAALLLIDEILIN
ncbi:MAG TPA: c-type cytochrome domain-containing protein [Chryseosolibacter sp.]